MRRVVRGPAYSCSPLPSRATLAEAAQLGQVGVDQVGERVVDVRDLLRRVPDEVAQLVDEGDVLDGEVGPPGAGQHVEVAGLQDTLADAAREAVLPQPPEHLRRLERRPPGADEVEEAVVGEDLLDEGLAASLQRALPADLAPQRLDERSGHAPSLRVAQALAQQPAADAGQVAAR